MINSQENGLQLVSPSENLQSAFLAFYADYQAHDLKNGEYYASCQDNFSAYVQRLTDESNGVNLREGYVPCSHFWLLNAEQQMLGVIRIRHHIDNAFLTLEAGHIGYDIAPSSRRKGYATSMLKLALLKAKTLGIDKALVTADEDNIASCKTIEKNGGIFENIVMGKVFPNPLARYWIHC